MSGVAENVKRIMKATRRRRRRPIAALMGKMRIAGASSGVAQRQIS
jgi:hypothetical protein